MKARSLPSPLPASRRAGGRATFSRGYRRSPSEAEAREAEHACLRQGPRSLSPPGTPSLSRRPVPAGRLVPPRLAGGGSAVVCPAAAAAAAADGGELRDRRQRGG